MRRESASEPSGPPGWVSGQSPDRRRAGETVRQLLRFSLLPLLLSGLAGYQCSWNAAGKTGCQPTGQPRPLPEALTESSGIAVSALRPDLLWSHNDGGHDALLYALDLDGRLLGSYPLDLPNRDWEDIATGRCDAGGCIYLADTGDNAEVRTRLDLLRIVDPGVGDGGQPLTVERFPVRLPNGPRDIEALFVLPGEEIYLVTKGRRDPVTVYRYPPPLSPDREVILEVIQELSDGPVLLPSQVTGADASADGKLIAVRTYRSLTLYTMREGHLHPVEGGEVDLQTLQEPQGEGVGIGPGGQILLTTEAGSFGGVASLRVLECRVRN